MRTTVKSTSSWETLPVGPKMDYIVGIQIMGFMSARFFRHGGGCYPADAKNVRHGKDAWGAHAEGGTYPFLLASGAIFPKKGQFGQSWAPSTDIRDAWYVLHRAGLLEIMRFDHLYQLYRFTCCTKSGHELIYAKGVTAPEAICRAAMRRHWEGKEIPA